jgi:NADP-dependent 3-hydroxy acid dehydrogenase YdfG
MNYVQDQVVVVTGAGSGFGKVTAGKLARLGGRIVLADINPETVQGVAAAISSDGGTAESIVVDVTVKEQVDAMVRTALTTFGRIDVLINNAGIMPNALFAAKRTDAWDRCIDINLKGPIYGIAAVLDTMQGQDRGHIVNVSSVYALGTHAGAGVYCATKAGLKMISDALRAETRGRIKVSTIYPSAAATNLGSTLLDLAVFDDFLGKHKPEFESWMAAHPEGLTNPDMADPKTMLLSGEAIADAIVYCINQPPGITISDIVVRATNEAMIY